MHMHASEKSNIMKSNYNIYKLIQIYLYRSLQTSIFRMKLEFKNV